MTKTKERKGKITLKDIQGKYDFKLNIKNTVSYIEKWVKYKGKVYRLTKITDEDWQVSEVPFMEEVPYIKI